MLDKRHNALKESYALIFSIFHLTNRLLWNSKTTTEF